MKLKAVYTVGELARAAGLDKRVFVRMLKNEGLVLRRPAKAGQPQLVTISQLRKSWPDLWDSLLQMQRLERESDEGRSRGSTEA